MTRIQLLFNFSFKKYLPLVKIKFALFYETESKQTLVGFPGGGPELKVWTVVVIYSRLESPQTTPKRWAFNVILNL